MKQTVQFFGSGVFSPLRKCLPHFRKASLAALLMLSASGVQAADSPGVKFNSGVRYSQWAIDSRANDFYANTTAFGLAKYKPDGVTVDKARKDTKGKLDYVPGLVAKSMIEAADYYQSFDWSKPWFASVKEYGDTYYTTVPNAGGSLDDLNAVKLYIGIYNDKVNASDADKTNATTALDRAKAGLIAHNKSNSIQSGTLAGDAVVGGWFHKADYNNQMWLDGAYMGSALLAQLTDFYGTSNNVFGSKDDDWNMVVKQLNIVWNMCWDSTDKLMYHAFEANAGTGTSKSYANTWYGLNGTTQPYTFHSAAYWGRANAWYLFALVDVLEAMKNDGQESTDNYATLKQHLTDLAAGIKARQSAEGGWYQLLDKDNTFTATSYNGKSGNASNYIETSATTLFSAAFFKAVRLGLLDDTYKEAAKKAFELVVNNYTYLDSNNNLEIWGSSRSAGLGGKGSNYVSGGKSFRNGSNEYYLLGSDVTMVKASDNLTEGKVLGGFIMAATEYERAYQNQDQKQILFARDLAPEYDFSATAGSLDATAYGSGTVAYQWYKADGTKVADATSATFAPTEDGDYYCKATAGSASIKTSTASVKAKTTTDGGDDTPSATTTLFSYTMLTSGSASTTDTDVTGGKIAYSGGSFSSAGFKIDSDSKYIKLTLDNTLKEGDIFEIAISSTTAGNGGIIASTTTTSTNGLSLGSIPTDAKKATIKYTVTSSDLLNGQNAVYLFRQAVSTYVSSIKISRAGSSEPTTTQYTVTATAKPTEGGTVTIKNGDNSVASGSKVDEKASVTFTATPAEGYEFTGWTVNNAAVEGTATTYSVASLAESTTVVANFKKVETPVTPASGKATFAIDDLKTLDSNPAAGEVSAINDGDVTITATKGISASSNGLKVSSSTTFTIGVSNGAKISKITVVQNTSNRECTYVPNYSEKTTDSGNTFVYTYDTDKPSLVTVTGPSSSMVISSIIVEYETTSSKTDLAASFASAEISAVEGDAAVALPALTVKADDKVLAETTDYTVTYKSNDEDVAKVQDGKVQFVGKGNTTIDVTVTPVNTSLYNGTTASFTVNVTENTTPVDPTKESVIYDLNTSVGTTTAGTNCTVTAANVKFGSDFRTAEGKYITVAPSVAGGFKAGDVITLHGFCDSKNNKSGAVIYSDLNAESSIFKTNTFASSANGGSDYTFTLTEDCDNLYFGRFGGGTTYITYLTVKRPAATEKTRLSASFERNADVVVNTKSSVDLPKLTVKAGDTELTNSQYNVEYVSNATDVATISGDVITIVGTGVATITATVTPTDADSYVGTTATYQLTVKEPTALNITIPDVTMNVTDVNYKQPEIKVYGDDDKLLTLGTDYTLSYTIVSGSNVTVDQDGKFLPTGESYKWTEGQTVFTVTATPTTELGDTYKEGSLQFAYSVVSGKATPAFMTSFASGKIKLHCDNTKRTFTVPLIYDHEDVSDYFDYTYSIAGKSQSLKKNTTHTMEYTPSAEGEYIVTVTAKTKTIGTGDNKVEYSDVYNNPASFQFTLDVKTAYQKVTISLDPAKVDLYTGTTESAPDVTVKSSDGKTVLDDSQYSVRWIVNNDAYARVDATTGRIEGVEEGSVKGRCTVTGDNLESTTAFFDINVDDPARYRAKDVDNDGKAVTYGNQAVLWNQNRDLQVTLGGWMFQNDVVSTEKRPLISSEGLKSSYRWSDTAGQAKWKLSGFTYMVNGDDQKNARQEDAANAMAQCTTLYNVTFTNSGTIKDQMFGVPCSGSYLVFNPKTAGVVTAHVFQNGVFDAKGTTYQYRPQRRVFVMDESGNVVATDAAIENANGKPTGGVKALNNYKWDINGEKAPTVDEVNSHFKGLNNFDISSADAFKNNVYESTFGPDGDFVKNPAASDNVKGSYGWSVLADSPVTYTFRVKPGKTYYLYNYGSKIGFYGYSFEEEKGQTVDEVSLDQNATNDIKTTEDGHLAKVSINRSLKAGQWSALVLPFSLNKPQVDAIFGNTYSAKDPDGTQILYFDRIEGSKAIFVRHAYNTIVAGKPFLIKPTKDVECINTADCAEFPYVTIENTKPAEWCKGDGYAWVSSYSNDMTVKTGDCIISNKDGMFKNYNSNPGTLRGFCGYLKRTDYGVQEVKQLRAATGSYVADDTTSAIDGIFLDSDGSAAVEAIADGKVYNMSGQVVATSAAALKSLPSGVYMLNGKKIVK